jgi:hypothetical protein
VEDRNKLRELTSRFRQAVEGQDSKAVVASYRRLWAAEFRAADPTAFDSVRAQVAKDIERVKQLDPGNTAVLKEGYKLIGDVAAANALQAKEKPREPKGFQGVLEAWINDHPSPNSDASANRRLGHRRLGKAESAAQQTDSRSARVFVASLQQNRIKRKKRHRIKRKKRHAFLRIFTGGIRSHVPVPISPSLFRHSDHWVLVSFAAGGPAWVARSGCDEGS